MKTKNDKTTKSSEMTTNIVPHYGTHEQPKQLKK